MDHSIDYLSISYTILLTLLLGALSWITILKQSLKICLDSGNIEIIKRLNLLKAKYTEIFILHTLLEIVITILAIFLYYYKVSAYLHFTHNTLLHTIVIALAIYVFSYIIPKLILSKKVLSKSKYYLNSEKLAKSFFIQYLSTKLNKHYTAQSFESKSNEEMDLEDALQHAKDESKTKNEKKLLEGIIRFGNTDVRQIMRSRVEVLAIDGSSNFADVLQLVQESAYSRIPVYADSLDQVLGVLYTKDLLPYLEEKEDFDWKSLLRKPFFIPDNKKIDDLLKDFQETKIHLGIVVDEYGGTSGIVTLEDILEEIVGNITDEFDEDDSSFKKIDDKNYVFEGRTSLNDVIKILDIDEDQLQEYRGDADSLGGLIIENAGRILKNRESITILDFKFTILASDKRRIKSVKITSEKN